MRKHTVVCSRHIARVRAAIRSWWRLASSRSTAVWSSRPTCRSRALRRATMAVERASWLSVLSLWLLSSSRTRAASFGGTSTTCSPAATSCWASNAPVPVAPSTAHTPRRELARPAQQSLSLLAVGGQLQHRPHLLIAIEHRGGV